MVAAMDTKVSGLEMIKPRLALAMRRFMLAAVNDRPRPSENIIVLGPTGGGKTLSLRTLLDFCPVIWAEGNATEYSDVGYRGRDLTSMYLGLLGPRWRGMNPPRRKGEQRETVEVWPERQMTALAERWGVVVLDEFDKLRNGSKKGEERDVGKVLQAELLKLVEGTDTLARKNDEERGVFLRTHNILHIAAGAFQGINEIVLKDLREAGMNIRNTAHAYEKVSQANLIDYGFMEELIGRFPTIITLPVLQGGHLARVLREHIVPPIMVQCADDDLELEITEGALTALGQEAMGFRVGARALSSLLNECLTEQWTKAQPGDKLFLDTEGVIHKTCTLIPSSAAA